MSWMNPLGFRVECDSFHFILVEFLTISHPIVYHSYILLLKYIQKKNDVPFSNPGWKIVSGMTFKWGEIWNMTRLILKIQSIVPWSFLFKIPLVWPNLDDPKKCFANIPNILIFGLSIRAHLYYMTHVHYFVSISQTSTTNTLVCLILYATNLNPFGSLITHIWHYSQEHLFYTSCRSRKKP